MQRMQEVLTRYWGYSACRIDTKTVAEREAGVTDSSSSFADAERFLDLCSLRFLLLSSVISIRVLSSCTRLKTSFSWMCQTSKYRVSCDALQSIVTKPLLRQIGGLAYQRQSGIGVLVLSGCAMPAASEYLAWQCVFYLQFHHACPIPIYHLHWLLGPRHGREICRGHHRLLVKDPWPM